jgi:transcriptional regulator with XRE-family HTH domain
MDTIASRLQAARKATKHSQESLARELNLSSKTIYRFESGDSEPSITMVRSIATVLGADADFILTGRMGDVVAPDEVA